MDSSANYSNGVYLESARNRLLQQWHNVSYFICIVNTVWHEANIDITGTPIHLIIVQDCPT